MREQTQQKSEPDVALERLTQRVAMETYELGGTKRVMHEIESYVSTLRAEQTRLREALDAANEHVEIFDSLLNQKDELIRDLESELQKIGTCRNGAPHYCPNCGNTFAALSSTPTPEHQ